MDANDGAIVCYYSYKCYMDVYFDLVTLLCPFLALLSCCLLSILFCLERDGSIFKSKICPK